MTSFEISHYFTLKSSMHHISNLLFLGLLLFTVVTLGLSSEQKESFKLELVQSNGGKDNNEISLIKLRAVIDKFQSMK